MLASELVAQVRRSAQLPSVTTDQLSDADILAHADMEIQSVLLPEVRQVQQEFLVAAADVASVNGFVPLPRRAATGAVRLVQLIQSGVAVTLPRVDPAQDPGRGAGGSGLPFGFYFDGGGIRLAPAVASGALRIRYYVTPPKLILDTDATRVARIVDVQTGASTYEVQTTDTGGGITADDYFDFIAAGGALNDVYGQMLEITGTPDAFTVPIASLAHPPRLDDYIVGYSASGRLDGVSPVVPLPEEMSPVVVARVAARALESLGYLQEAGAKWASAEAALKSARRLLTPRSDGNPRVLVNGLHQAIRGPGSWRNWGW